MATIGNLPGADLLVTFPTTGVRNVNMIRLLVQTQNAEFKRDHGTFLPGVAKLHPTVKALREEYELDWFASEVYPRGVRTWEECAHAMRHFYDLCDAHVRGV